MKFVFALGAMALAGCSMLGPEMTPVQQVEAHMKGYTEAWNRHDAAGIAKSFYRLGPSVEDQTRSLEKSFADLRARGYDHSDIYEIKGCMTGPDTAWAAMKFSRLKTDGTPLQANLASAYNLTKFPDGWRITKMGAGGATFDKPLQCPPAAPAAP
jgi:hypothetical protein